MALSGGDGCCWEGWPQPKGKSFTKRKKHGPLVCMAWSLLLDDCEEMEMIGDAS